jgi:hypothetical protein
MIRCYLLCSFHIKSSIHNALTCLFSCKIDYHRVTDVWVKHWWATPSMAWFRELFCQGGTANTLCAAPTLGGKYYDSTDEWCLSLYNSTDCQTLRDSAQLEMRTSTYIFFTINAIAGLFLIVLVRKHRLCNIMCVIKLMLN